MLDMAHKKGGNVKIGRPKKRGVKKKDKLRARGHRINAFKIGVIVGRVLEADRRGVTLNLAALGRTPEICAGRSTVSSIVNRYRKGELAGGLPTQAHKRAAHTVALDANHREGTSDPPKYD